MFAYGGAISSGDAELMAAGRASLETMSAFQSLRGMIQRNVNPDTGYISTENAGAIDANPTQSRRAFFILSTLFVSSQCVGA